MCRKTVFRRQLKTPGKKEHPKRKKCKQKFFHFPPRFNSLPESAHICFNALRN